jgi:retron-type reverse transcriptase
MIISSDIDNHSLFEQVICWENLLLAYRNAARGKRGAQSAAAFEHQLADRLILLQSQLTDGTYRPGDYVHFTIHDPKTRRISAAPFRDRVVHHALCNVIEPIMERRFHPHSYANRIGKGTHAAIDTLQGYARRYRYVLRIDIVKHFPAIDHAVLTDILADEFPDERVQALMRLIIDSGQGILDDQAPKGYFPGDDLFAPLRPRGLPIGNLTSQFWSNVYMNPFDWCVYQELGCPAYLRYVDDFALFSDSKRKLYRWKEAIIDFLATLRLTIHEREAQVIPCTHGIPWLGFVVYPTHRRLKARNAVNFTRRFTHALDLYEGGLISFAELDAGVQGWINHVRYADTWGLREHIFSTHPIRPPKKR